MQIVLDSTPPLTMETFTEGVETFVDYLSRELVWQPRYDHPAVWVLSTGRCGTSSLRHFLKLEPCLDVYHGVHQQLNAGDRNDMLWSILNKDFGGECFSRILDDYFDSRMVEYTHAMNHKKTLVICNHLDTIFAVYNAIRFPNSKFLFLEREPRDVYKSMVSKQQWTGQLRPRRAQVDIETSMAFHCWVTRCFSRAVLDLVGPERSLYLRSEDLFKRKEFAFVQLEEFFGLERLDFKAFQHSFSMIWGAKESFFDKSVELHMGRFQQVHDRMMMDGKVVL